MNILMFGATGQVETEVLRRIPAGVSVQTMGRDVVDLSDAAACAELVMGTDADVVLNAAAWTAVDKAETEEAAALEDGLRRRVRWYLDNEAWWRPLLNRQSVGTRLGVAG